ncbi:hypothetical protein [Phaeovulum sp.]|uniref:hypothetical protein n=1 Tax=Phaeovulum sp. TaxID=2934796 RepID=UPI0039E3D593
MALIDDLADALARDTLALMEETGEERLFMQVSKAIGTLSPTVEEAFLTAIRIRQAEARGRKYLEQAAANFRKAPK